MKDAKIEVQGYVHITLEDDGTKYVLTAKEANDLFNKLAKVLNMAPSVTDGPAKTSSYEKSE